MTRQEKRRAERALRRELRRDRIENELGSLFDLFRREDRDDFEPRRQRRNSLRDEDGFYLDDYDRPRTEKRRKRRKALRQPKEREPVFSEPLPEVTPQEEIARLPDVSEPVERTTSANVMPKPKYNQTRMASLQVFLDREGFSPGAIDGRWGSNVSKAVTSWKQATGDKANLGNATVLDQYISRTGGSAFTRYTITAADVAGPYVRSVPVDYAKKAELKALSYTSVQEMLAEKFHMSQSYLLKLNPGKNFRRAGTTIKVIAPGSKVTRKVHYIVADKSRKQIRAFDRNGKLVTAYPATIGSAATPSPTGSHSVARIAINPEYTYNPKINFTQGKNKEILRISPGPNGPVGSVWIALSKPTYGIHGTPNPDTIGKTSSHGCIRLTNWDAAELAKLVSEGVTVEFVE